VTTREMEKDKMNNGFVLEIKRTTVGRDAATCFMLVDVFILMEFLADNYLFLSSRLVHGIRADESAFAIKR
jgi:hypothetical protein